MTDEEREELKRYFDGYGSPHDETILNLIDDNEHLQSDNETLASAYNDARKEISLLKKHAARNRFTVCLQGIA